MIDIKERIEQNEVAAKQIQAQLQQMQQTSQQLLQALLKLEGQRTLLLEMQAEDKAE